jgi:hypothetical protein
MLSFTVTILRIGSQECLDKATATGYNSMIAGVVYQLLIPPTQVKKLPEHSRPLERWGTYEKDLDTEGSGSITSSGNIYIKSEYVRRNDCTVTVSH